MNLLKEKLIPLCFGFGLAVGTLLLLVNFSYQMVIEFAAILLSVIAAIYIGYAISDGERVVKRVEIGTAVLFIIIALAGLWYTPWLLVIGYIGHGLWDWLHHADLIHLKVVDWYPPFCAIYDLVVGLGLVFWLV